MLFILRKQQAIQRTLRWAFHAVLGFGPLDDICTTWGCVSLPG
jgi:hypothetical protein